MRKRRNVYFSNRKGSLTDIMFYAIMIGAFAISVLLGFKIAAEFNNQVQTMDVTDAATSAVGNKTVAHYSGIMDNSILFITIGIGMGTLVLAALVRVHPIFIPLFFIGLVLVIFLSAIISNIYDEMANDPQLTTQANQLDKTSFIITKLPFIVGIFGILLMMVMYKLWRTDNAF